MNAAGKLVVAGFLALVGGVAMAAGVNGIFDLNYQSDHGIIEDLQADKSSFTATKDLARFDAAVEAFQAAPETPLTDTASVKAFQKAMAKLGKIAKDATVAPQIDAALGTLYSQVYGYNSAAGGSAALYYNAHQSRHDIVTYGRLVLAFAKRLGALEATQGAGKHAGWKPSQKLALFLSVCRASDALVKKYGAPQ